jgi:hypothetical protein
VSQIHVAFLSGPLRAIVRVFAPDVRLRAIFLSSRRPPVRAGRALSAPVDGQVTGCDLI